jgi:hypothetical protein
MGTLARLPEAVLLFRRSEYDDRHSGPSGMARKRQTRHLEISGSMLRIAPE